ncbi:MAG: hypothetical protein K2O78_00190 [Muribaculaceae bacterium]|nr:hypothetical protein [Muribaculaceae bacterium]
MITSDADLRLFLPNSVITVGLETPLFDKLAPFLRAAEDTIARSVVSPPILEAVARAEPELMHLRQFLRPLVAIRAFCDAVPSLDIILTPNGFGVVSNSNVVPASESRVRALRDSLLLRIDQLTEQTVDALRPYAPWRDSPQGRLWGSVLPLQLRTVRRLRPDHHGPLLEAYEDLRPQIRDMEDRLADRWISPELLEELRRHNLARSPSDRQSYVIAAFSAAVIDALRTGTPDERRLAQIVDDIRRDPATFHRWHNSRTARLFSPPVFRNNPLSGGYFF